MTQAVIIVKIDLGFLSSVGLWLAGLGKLVDHI